MKQSKGKRRASGMGSPGSSRRRVLGGMAGAAALGLLPRPALAQAKPVKLGITGGTQGLWRWIASNKVELLDKPLGTTFEFKIFPSDAGMRTTFLADDLDVFTTIVPEAPALNERKLDVQFIFPIAWVKEAAVLIFTKESGVKTIAEAKGRKVASIPLQNAGGAVFRALLLENHGIKIEEHTQLVGTPFPEVPLEAGQTEGAVVLSRQWSRLQESGKYVALTSMAAEWAKVAKSPRLIAYGGLIARRSWIGANKPAVDALIAAAVKGMEHLKRDRAAWLEIVRNYTADGAIKPQPLPEATFNTWSLGLDDVGPDRVKLTQADAEDYRVLFGLLQKSGYLKGAPDTATLFHYG